MSIMASSTPARALRAVGKVLESSSAARAAFRRWRRSGGCFGERRDNILRKAAEGCHGHGGHVVQRDIADRSVGVYDSTTGVGQGGGCRRGAQLLYVG
jgi:hypothetical protein